MDVAEHAAGAETNAVASSPSGIQEQARQAVARLTGTTLSVASERIFRSDETPRLKLVTRNVESVGIRAYKVDLETYFRKMHQVRGVQQLNISLIDPDRSFEFKVPKFAKYQKLESAIEVPLPEGLHAGVMAVTVSSKTLEATTLVIQSDLDVIVKTSGDELFVFAQNMLTGKPWPGVKLLASDGFQVLAEAATDQQGIFRKQIGQSVSPGGHAGGEFCDASQARIFAVSGGHVAASEGPLAQAPRRRRPIAATSTPTCPSTRPAPRSTSAAAFAASRATTWRSSPAKPACWRSSTPAGARSTGRR